MPCFRRFFACISALAIALLWLGVAPTRAVAGLVLTVEPSSAAVGGVGSFDVLLSDTGGSYQIGSFSVELAVATNSGVEFTAANTNTTMATYIFGTLQSPPFYFNTFPIQDFTVSDSSFTPPYYASLTTGQTVGLEHVTYSVAAGTAPGPVTITLADIGVGTSLSDAIGDNVTFTPSNGTITVTPSSVPEPCSLVLLATALAGTASIVRVRRLRGDLASASY
jgi:hypothetical protein